MSLKLLIDEDSQAKVLVSMLRKASHNVVTVNELGLMSQPDEAVLADLTFHGFSEVPIK